MNHRQTARHLLFVLIALTPSVVLAQADDPFGLGGTPAGPGPAVPPAKRPDPLGREDPVILAIRESNPTTPSELMRAAQAMIDYGEIDEAKKYITALTALKPDAATLAKLEDEFGTPFFMRLVRDDALAPEGPVLGQAVLSATGGLARDEKHLADQVDLLGDPSLEARSQAMRELHRAGLTALPLLMKALADESRAAHRPAIQDALVALKLGDVEPFIGALESTDDSFRASIVNVLGRYGDRRATVFLVAPFIAAKSSEELHREAKVALMRIVGRTPGTKTSLEYLHRQAKEFFEGKIPGYIDYRGFITLWHWDPRQQTTVPVRYMAEDASLVTAARIAGELYRLAPTNIDYRRLYLSALLEAAKSAGGRDRPLFRGPGTPYAQAAALGQEAIEDVLVHSVETGRVVAAAAAVEVLGDIGDERLIMSTNGRRTPLTLALSHSDLRLRFAAAEAIAAIDPRQQFPGSSHVVDVFAFSAATAGAPRVLVADPRTQNAQTLGAMLGRVGFEADAAYTGRGALKVAQSTPDFELILISDAIDDPPANELMQQLRRDPRTAKVPIGLLARPETIDDWKVRVRQIPLAEAFHHPYSPEGALFEINRLLAEIGRGRVLVNERLRQAETALEFLAIWANDPARYRHYDVMRHEEKVIKALFAPGLAEPAARVLGATASPRAQTTLVDYVSQNSLPLADRQAAATAFAAAVDRRGILLTEKQLLNQYDRYNKSKTLDPETQDLLGSLLDVIEARSKRKPKSYQPSAVSD